MMNARNTPNILPLPFCVTLLCSILAWCAGIFASENAQRPYVPPSETPSSLISTPEQVIREVLIQVAPGFMEFPEGKVVAEWHEFENVAPALKDVLDRYAPEILIKAFPNFDPTTDRVIVSRTGHQVVLSDYSRIYKLRFPPGADRTAISEDLQGLPGVVFAEPNGIISLGCSHHGGHNGFGGAAMSDFDDDGTVGFSDFVAFAAEFGKSSGDEDFDARFDLDGDGAIGFGDFEIFARNFGKAVDVITMGICNRTPQVRDAILRVLSAVDDCALATTEQLSSITGLYLGEACITALEEADFSGLSGLKGLELSQNKLTTLLEGVFASLDSLQVLELRYNGLRTLPEGVFSGLSNLKGLALSYNGLSTLPEGVFSDLSSLQRVGLRSNGLSALPDGVFSGLDSLRTLKLEDNDLSALPDGVFSGLSGLRTLYLDENALSTLPEGVFSDLSSLRTLRLEDNDLSTLVEGVFTGLDRLEMLWLSHNALTTVHKGAFSGLNRLRVLLLDENDLSTLVEGVFSGLDRLEALWLFNNALSTVHKGAFSGLDSLRALDLSHNNLSTLPDSMFFGLDKLKVLWLDNNPGSPFTLTMELQRTDNRDNAAPGPATIVVTLAEGAPFDMTVTLSAQAGTLSVTTATISSGHTESEPVVVTQTGAGPTTVSLGAAPEIPVYDDGSVSYDGIRIAAGAPLVLFPQSAE